MDYGFIGVEGSFSECNGQINLEVPRLLSVNMKVRHELSNMFVLVILFPGVQILKCHIVNF